MFKNTVIFLLGGYVAASTLANIAAVVVYAKDHPQSKAERFKIVEKEYNELKHELYSENVSESYIPRGMKSKGEHHEN